MRKYKFLSVLFFSCYTITFTFCQCNIEVFEIFPFDEANCSGEIYTIQFDFEATSFGEQGFCVTDGIATQCYELGEDYIFNAISDCTDGVILTIFDQLNPNCASAISVYPLCCPCEVGSYTMTTEDCYQNSLTDIIHNINIIGGSCITDEDWLFIIEDQTYEVIWDGANLVSIGVDLNPNIQMITAEICSDITGQLECYSNSFLNPCFIDGTDCEITTFDFEGSLECVDNFIVSEWIILSEGSDESGYDLFVDGIFYDFLPWNDNGSYSLEIENNESEVMQLWVCANDNPDCCTDITIENPCFENTDQCFIGDLDIEIGQCNDDNFVPVSIFFDYADTSEEFSIVGNGNNYGTFAYEDLPVTFEVIADCALEYEFIVIDSANEDCLNFAEVQSICCTEDCTITTFDFEGSLECVDNFIVSEWIILSEGSNESGYDLFIDGVFYDFLPWNDNGSYILEIENNGLEVLQLLVCANDDPDCCTNITVENPCFEEQECPLDLIDFEIAECVDSEVSIFIITSGLGEEVGMLDLTISNVINETLFEAQITTFEEDFVANISNFDSPYFIFSFSSPDVDCIGIFEVENPCFQEVPCPVDLNENLEINLSCMDDLTNGSISLDGSINEFPNLSIALYDELLGDIEPNDAGIYEFSFQNSAESFLTFLLCAQDLPNCCTEIEVINPCILDNVIDHNMYTYFTYDFIHKNLIYRGPEDGDLKMYTLSGQLVRQMSIADKDNIGLGNFDSGIYIVVFVSESGRVVVGKIPIVHE